MQLDVLEYIHEHEYVHADIKASNLLLSHTDPNQVCVCLLHRTAGNTDLIYTTFACLC